MNLLNKRHFIEFKRALYITPHRVNTHIDCRYKQLSFPCPERACQINHCAQRSSLSATKPRQRFIELNNRHLGLGAGVCKYFWSFDTRSIFFRIFLMKTTLLGPRTSLMSKDVFFFLDFPIYRHTGGCTQRITALNRVLYNTIISYSVGEAKMMHSTHKQVFVVSEALEIVKSIKITNFLVYEHTWRIRMHLKRHVCGIVDYEVYDRCCDIC